MTEVFSTNTHKIDPLPTPVELIRQLPASGDDLDFINSTRQTIRNILDGKDPRLILITGPCSIHDPASAKEYALRLSALKEEVSEAFFLVMRVYFEKPRTTLGWKGLLYDPFLDGSNDMRKGMLWTRTLLLELAKLRVPVASEFLDPVSPYYFGDLISWACIGARTSSSQIHRQMASGLPMPVAFKNSTDGNYETAINGVLTAMAPHSFMGVNEEGNVSLLHTQGNPYGHIVLRGGEQKPNYDSESISKALMGLQNASLPKRLIIDCSHDNSNRNHARQREVFESVLHQWSEGNQAIRGMVLESHLHAGNQTLTNNLSALKYAVSLTDPCLDWEETHRIVNWGYSHIKHAFSGLEASRFV